MTTIPLTDPVVERIKELIPVAYHAVTWIAGSAVTHWGQNADVDAWVLGRDYREAKFLIDFVKTFGHAPDDLTVYLTVVGSSLVYAHEGLHLLVAEGTIQDVVANFDIACHAAAINLVSGELYRHPAQHANLVRPLLWRSPQRALQRLLRFADRYQDETIWHDAQCQKLARRAFDLIAVTAKEKTLLDTLRRAVRAADQAKEQKDTTMVRL